MSKVTVISVPQELSDYIESLQYETFARKDAISFMIEKGMDKSEAFERYHKEYVEYYAKYESAKHELENDYILKEHPVCDWNLNFLTHEVTITDKE